ncbi:unnamed protein product, partial [Pylaiella littoralis]
SSQHKHPHCLHHNSKSSLLTDEQISAVFQKMKGIHGLIVGLGLAMVPHLAAAQTCSDGVTVGVDGNEVVCCTPGCPECGGSSCGSAAASVGLSASDCCGSNIKSSGVMCGAGAKPAPCILGGEMPVTTCSDDVTVGVDGNGVVCCPSGCSQCGGSNCATAGDDCCGGPIKASGVYCGGGDNPAPCILGNDPDVTTCADGVTVGVGSGSVCCGSGCTQCGGSGCTTAGDDCCGNPIKDAGVYCENGANPSPCIIGFAPGTSKCIDDVPGVDGNGAVCCTLGCTQCGGSGCGTAGAAAGLTADDCCGSNIRESGIICDGTNVPCI